MATPMGRLGIVRPGRGHRADLADGYEAAERGFERLA
jgi:hypothetical protein